MITPVQILNAKVLLVDDQVANVKLLERILRQAGYVSITSTLNPEEVCDLHTVHCFDLIVLDLEMPGLNGFEVMEALQKIEPDGYLPVLAFTAEPDHKVRALKAGARDFISKPFDLAEVLTRVRNMVEVRLLHKETKLLYAQVVADQLALVIAKDVISRHALQLEQIVDERTSQLRETVGKLEAFSYSVSHDMRAPLRAMQGYASVLIDEYSACMDSAGVDYLQQIMRSSVRLDSLIRDVLNYTKIMHSAAPMERVDMDRLVRDYVETQPFAGDLKPLLQINGALPPVVGNEALLTQCISNLVRNGAKFVAPGITPHVVIWAEERTPSLIRVWFKDNGIGIATENHHRIFRMFERIHPAAEYEGTGIGLTIVRKAVERMEAQVGFESELGKGSSFWIDLKKG